MPSFKKISASKRNVAYMGLELEDPEAEITVTQSKYGIQIPIPKGQESILNIVPGDVLVVNVGKVKPKTYHMEVSAHPILHQFTIPSYPRIIEPGDEVDLYIVAQALGSIDLSTLSYLVRLYLRD